MEKLTPPSRPADAKAPVPDPLRLSRNDTIDWLLEQGFTPNEIDRAFARRDLLTTEKAA